MKLEMLNFGTRKMYVEEMSEYEILEEEAFALLESILENGNDGVVNQSEMTQIDTRKETFALLDVDKISDYGEEQELRELEQEPFLLLDMTLQDNDEWIDPDIISTNKVYQHHCIDPLEMEKLEEEVFALLETVLEDDEPIDEDILFPVRKPLLMNPQETQNLGEAFILLELAGQDDSDLDKIDFMFSNISLEYM